MINRDTSNNSRNSQRKKRKAIRRKESRHRKRELRQKIDNNKKNSKVDSVNYSSSSSLLTNSNVTLDYIFIQPREIEQDSTNISDLNSLDNTNKYGSSSLTEVFKKYFSFLQPFSIEDKINDKVTSEVFEKEKTNTLSQLNHIKAIRKEAEIESKKKVRIMSRMSILELKQKSGRPDIVEIWDPSAPYPLTLLHLKSYRNSVHVPSHWSQKRKYLQGKRGIEKPPFKLPAFIESTGICSLRDTYNEKEDGKKSKQKGRERVRPKMNKLDINYEVLRDAFFKNQDKPRLTTIGELYYEGREFEFPIQNWRPGTLSEKLKDALGMDSNGRIPPPWLINMQRYGPPPSYPSLKVPGLNAPIPTGCQFGYGPGEWGKPPLNMEGNAPYNNSFTTNSILETKSTNLYEENVDKSFRWGNFEEIEENPDSFKNEKKNTIKDDDGTQSARTVISSARIEFSKLLNLRKEVNTVEMQVSTAPEKEFYSINCKANFDSRTTSSDHINI
jgi:splicing factor 3B subunit 2